MRLFVAITLPEQILAALERIQQNVPGAHWTPPENRHLTLRFLGEVNGADFQDLMPALADAAVPPFEIEIASVGHFERRQIPTVLWAGIRPSPYLQRLQAKVEQVVRSCSFPQNRANFHRTSHLPGSVKATRCRCETSFSAIHYSPLVRLGSKASPYSPATWGKAIRTIARKWITCLKNRSTDRHA